MIMILENVKNTKVDQLFYLHIENPMYTLCHHCMIFIYIYNIGNNFPMHDLILCINVYLILLLL